MVDLLNIADVAHDWGGDLQLSQTGDLARCITTVRSKQHVLRRLLTSPGDYLVHTEYGAGLPLYVGSNLDLAKVTANIRGQMGLEASVAQSPEPAVSLTAIPQGLSADIGYTVAPEKIPAVLSFSVSA